MTWDTSFSLSPARLPAPWRVEIVGRRVHWGGGGAGTKYSSHGRSSVGTCRAGLEQEGAFATQRIRDAVPGGGSGTLWGVGDEAGEVAAPLDAKLRALALSWEPWGLHF